MLSSRILGDSGVQLNFDVDSFTDYQGETPEDRTQLNINAQKAFMEDRLVVQVGSEVDIQGGNTPGQESSPLIGTVSIAYLLDEQGVWRIKGFRRNQFENVIDGQLIVSGISLIFTKEFNKFKELFEKAVVEEANKQQENKKSRRPRLLPIMIKLPGMKRISSIVWICIIFIALYSCSVKKFIPEDEYLYTGADIEIEADTTIKDEPQLKAELENVLRPQPNSKILGGYPGVYFYYKANREKPGFINKFLNKNFGEEPVYISEVDLTNTEDLLLNRLENRGFFYSRVSSDTAINAKAKTGMASFKLRVPEPYTMETYQLDTDTMLVYTEIKRKMDNSLLEKGMRFDLPDLKAERERIDADLKQSGYYNFNPGFLLFEADTNQYDTKRFDLYLKLKKNVPAKSIIPYEISNVNVYANYNIDEDSITRNFKRYKNKNYFQENIFFKPERLDPYILIETGDYYDPEISRNTSRRLGSIGSYKFVNIEYEEIDTLATDSIGLLQANIYLSPLKKRAIRAELQAVTKSNSFTGPHLAVTFANRNLFKGGESLNISANVGYEFQVSSGERLSSLQLGLKNDLIIPRLIFPIEVNNNFFQI